MKDVSTVFVLALAMCATAVAQPAAYGAEAKFRDPSGPPAADVPVPAADGPLYQVAVFVGGRAGKLYAFAQ